MSFPPLPPVLCHTQDLDEQYTADQMRAYREHALEEAAMAAEDGFKYALDGYQIADKIRSLK